MIKKSSFVKRLQSLPTGHPDRVMSLALSQCSWCDNSGGQVVFFAVFYGELDQRKQDRGATHKRFKDPLKQHLLQGGLDPPDFETSAADTSAWRLSTQ